MKRTSFLLTALASIITLVGCAKYKARPMSRLFVHGPQDKKADYVSFSYQVLSQDDCYRYLDRDVISKGYQPVHISLTNKSDRCINLDIHTFSFPCASAHTVAKTVHTNTAGRAIGYGIAGFFIPLFWIPAIVDGVGSSQANEKLDEDFYSKTLQSQTMKPASTVNGLIFVPVNDFRESFTFTVTDAHTNERFELGSHTLWVLV